jgi:D-alanine-D-alanine ligase
MPEPLERHPVSRHVVVLKGGVSSEREVSLRSGAECAAALRAAGYAVTEHDVDGASVKTLGRDLPALKPDVVFLALHGRFGEDGTVQGLLELLRRPYTHSGVLASALAMNKQVTKTVLAAAGVPVAPGRLVARLDAAREHAMSAPYVLKPNEGGSSIGVFIVREDLEHPPQELWSESWEHGEMLIAERFVAGKELTCAVLGDRALGVIEIVQDNRFYDYEAKYAEGGSRHILPARIQPNIYHEVQKLSLEAHRALGCRGVTRADFRFDDTDGGTGELVCLEVNTQPGMTRTSLVPELAAHAGLSFPDLVRWMVEDASCDR